MIDFLEKNLNPQAFAMLLLCICVIYIWFLHLRNKLLKEQIEFEKDKRENFLDELNKLKNLPKATISTSVGLYDSASRILIVDDEPFLRDLLVTFLLHHYLREILSALVPKGHRKLASYEVAGKSSKKNLRPERTPDGRSGASADRRIYSGN